MKNIQLLAVLILLMLSNTSCEKFLDEKPDKKLVIPSTLQDLQAIMDNTNIHLTGDPYIGEMSSDDFYLTQAVFNSTLEIDQNLYLWKRINCYNPDINSWSNLYAKIYYTNTVLEQLQKIERTAFNQTEWDNLKGQALMVRGRCFMQGVLLWAKAFDSTTAATDPGIPLRLSTSFDEPVTRATVQQCYQQLTADLKASINLLPVTPVSPARASRPAALAYLARVYLSTRNYDSVAKYAAASLSLQGNLLDYNTLNASASFPIPRMNTEILHYSGLHTLALSVSNARVDSVLYNSYSSADCRKKVFFRLNTDGTYGFKGTYISATGNFAGIATDEVYLMKAEALARQGLKEEALVTLNMLLKNRYDRVTFVPVTATDAAAALQVILQERRKELLFRGLRWMDLKRFNKENAGIVLTRKINNTEFKLLPNSTGYALPIPEYVIEMSQIPQNP